MIDEHFITSQNELYWFYACRIGCEMVYKPTHAKEDNSQWEYGTLSCVKISEFTGEVIIWVKFKGPNGERCNLEDIDFI